MIEHNEWICPIKPIHGDNAYYSISKKEIVIPEKSQFKDGESFYSNLFHEMAHSTGAEDQLDRLKPTSFGKSEGGTNLHQDHPDGCEESITDDYPKG